MTSTRNELINLIEGGIITPSNIDEAFKSTGLTPDGGQWRLFLDRLILWLGTLMLGLAVVFFFAYNWKAMGAFAKFGLAELAMFASVMAYWKLDSESIAAKSTLLAATLCLGALMALYGQTYQTGADPWQLFANWALLMLPWVLIARFATLWILWLALLNLAIGLYYYAHPATFSILFRGNDTMLLSLFAFNAAAMVCWEQLGKRFTCLAEHWAFRLLAAAALLPLTIVMIKNILQDISSYGVASGIWAVWLLFLYVRYRRMGQDLFVLTLAALSLFVVGIAQVSHWFKPSLTNIEGFLFMMFISVIAMGSLLVMWLKNLHKEWAA